MNLYEDLKNKIKNNLLENLDIEENRGNEAKDFFNQMMKKDPPPTLPDDRKINLLSLWKKFLKRMGADGSSQTEGEGINESPSLKKRFSSPSLGSPI